MTYKIVPRFIPIDKPSRISPIVNRPVFERIIVRLRLVFLIIPLIFRSVAFSCPVVDATPCRDAFRSSRTGKNIFPFEVPWIFFFVRFSRRSVCLNWNRDKQEPLKSSVLIFLVCWGTVHLFTFALRSGCSLYRLFSRNVENFKKIYIERGRIYISVWGCEIFSFVFLSVQYPWTEIESKKNHWSLLYWFFVCWGMRNLPASALRTVISINEQTIFPQNTLVWYIL